jgi:hypothetical protein
LHWQFQGERAKRRLSNEKAILEPLAGWIAHPEKSSLGVSKIGHSRRNPLLPTSPHERESVEILFNILRDRHNPVRAAALQAVLAALSSRAWEERTEENRAGISAPGSDEFEKRVAQLHQSAKDARRGAKKT